VIGKDRNVLLTGLASTVHGPVLFVLHQTVYALVLVPGLQRSVIAPFEAVMLVMANRGGNGTKLTAIGVPRLLTCS